MDIIQDLIAEDINSAPKIEKKVSVVVPIYNMKKYIAECIESLISQTFPKEQMQVLLINDGSTDNTAEIIKDYTKIYDFLEYHEKENGGVSDARNYGIKQAAGKYIMFLDADDKFSPETVKNCVNFFDAHYDEIDIATYLIQPFADDKAEHKLPPRLTEYKGYGNKTEIYDLEKNPYIYLKYVNVIVKNTEKNNVMFKYSVCENILYNSTIANIKRKYGFIGGCKYFYRRDNENSVSSSFFPTTAFEPFIQSMDELFDKSTNWWDRKVAKHVQAAFIGEILEKVKENILFPYHYSEKDFKTANERIDSLLERVEIDIINKFPKADIFHRHWLLSRKKNLNAYIKKTENCYSVFAGKIIKYDVIIPNAEEVYDLSNKADIIFRNSNNEWFSVTESKKICDLTNIVFSVIRITVVDNKLTFYGFAKSGFYSYINEDIDLWATEICDGKINEIKLNTFIAGESRYRCRTQTNKFYGFIFECDLSYVRGFRFYVKYRESTTKPGSFWFYQHVGINDNRIIKGGYKINFDGNNFRVSPCDTFNETEQLTEKVFKNQIQIYTVRKIGARLRQNNNIHLYLDINYVKKDNAYYQFKNDFYKKDGIQRYYITDTNEEEYDEFFTKEEQKYVVKYFSMKHKQLYLAAEKIFTSFIGNQNQKHCPFTVNELTSFADMLDFEIIYLGHGVLYGIDMISYHAEWGNTDKFVISSNMEYKNLIENYNWHPKRLLATGAPRYNYINRNITPSKKILFAPSWRSYFAKADFRNKEESLNAERFKNHIWHKSVYKFLTSPKISELLKQYGYKLDFKPHPIIAGASEISHIYSKTFGKNNPIRIVTEDVPIEEYAVFITDYSSFVFDFVYLNRAIMYFFPDYDEWRSGIYHYRQVAVPFEEAFGPFTTEAETAIDNLRKILENNAVPEDIYADRMKDFFLPMSDNICDDVYNQNI